MGGIYPPTCSKPCAYSRRTRYQRFLYDAAPPIIASLGAIVATDGHGVAVAIRLVDLMKSDTRTRIDGLAASLGVAIDEVDLVVDLGAPNFEPYDVFASALLATIRRLGDLHAFRNFVVIGTAIPATFKDVAKGANQLARHDWLFYRVLLGRMPAGMRQPNYGDFTIVHPEIQGAEYAHDQSGRQDRVHDAWSLESAQGRGIQRQPRPDAWSLRVNRYVGKRSTVPATQAAMITSPNARFTRRDRAIRHAGRRWQSTTTSRMYWPSSPRLPLRHKCSDRGRDLAKGHGFTKHFVKMLSGPSELSRSVSDLAQQTDDFITPEKMRHHNGIDVGVGHGIPHHMEADAASWPLLGHDHTTPLGGMGS